NVLVDKAHQYHGKLRKLSNETGVMIEAAARRGIQQLQTPQLVEAFTFIFKDGWLGFPMLFQFHDSYSSLFHVCAGDQVSRFVRVAAWLADQCVGQSPPRSAGPVAGMR